MVTTQFIPKERFNLWYDLFKASGGRFLSNPVMGERVYVHYEFDDMVKANAFESNYYRLITPIVETRQTFWQRVRRTLPF